MKQSILFTCLFQKIRFALVSSFLLIIFSTTQSISAQTTYTVSTTNGSINSAATWSSGFLPVSNDMNIWSTGALILKQTTTPITFNGGTLVIASGGTLNMSVGSSILNLNNATLDGGTISTASGSNINLNFQNNIFALNSGNIKTLSTGGTSGTRNIVFQNCSLTGNGTITIAQYNAGAMENYVEIQSTVTTTGFTGIFEVVPGLMTSTGTPPVITNGIGGQLKLNTIDSGTFGVSIPAINASSGVVSNGGTYKSTLNGKLYFTPGVGKTVTLASLNLGGTEIAPGMYAYSDFASYGAGHLNLQGYLNGASTGTITVTGTVNAPTAVVATNVNGVASVAFSGTATNFTVTPYDVTTSMIGVPVTGVTSPILLTGLTNNDSYTFTVTANNVFGISSPASDASAPILINSPGVILAEAAGEINALSTWRADNSIPIPIVGDSNIWSTGNFAISETFTPITFNGGTLNVATGGSLSMAAGSSIININNILLNGGSIQNTSGFSPTINLQNNTLTLNSGSFKTVSSSAINRNLLFQNAVLAGNGTITIAQLNAGTFENNVDFTGNTLNTTGFTGKFEVAPGLSGTGVGGTLKLNAIASGTFGVSVLAASATGVTSNSAALYYKSTTPGKLYFNQGVGNTLTLVSLTLGGVDVAPGTYGLTAGAGITTFTSGQQIYLNSASTGTILVTGAVYPPTNVVGGALVYFTDTLNNGGYTITRYTVTPYDLTTSTLGTPVNGTASPISVPGLIKNHSYTFTVTATNKFGLTSPASVASIATGITAPAAPIIGKAYTSGLSGTAYVAFTAPLSDGGSPITSYKVSSIPAKGSGTYTDKNDNGIITVTGLTNKIPYTFTITATNAMGTSVASTASNSITVDPTTFVAPPKIITVSDPTKTTQQLTSGNFTIGVTNFGGGVINQVLLPGVGEIMGVEAKLYGRSGQAAIRDRGHSGWYNPTQAGFNEKLGTPCQIDQTPGKLVVQPRGISLWYGDGNYDFTRWENIGPDPYTEKTFFGGAVNASDQDGLNEENLAVDIKGNIYTKQEAEVYSEFDYYGTYEDYLGKNGISTPAIRHYYEFRFVRPPGHCLNQFREGTPPYSPLSLRSDLSHVNPSGIFAGTDKDMSVLVPEWALRHDRIKWKPKYSYFRNKDKSWTVTLADNDTIAPNNDGLVFIIADANNPATGSALGLYRPKTEINQYPVVGMNEITGTIVYKDDRQVISTDGFKIDKNMLNIPTMSTYGFVGQLSGMINRSRLDPNVYETFRSEYFIFCGTPNQIMAAVAAYDSSQLVTGITDILKENKNDFQIISDQSTNSFVVKLNAFKQATIRIYNPMGKLLYSTTNKTDRFTIHENEIGSKGVLLVQVNGETKKIILL